ncbi:MAG: leucine-rich repeat domain-containing protein [Clostridia bacterium]|nr:leucine-rich repeat domain-containing protein [Clostridia bacterium]
MYCGGNNLETVNFGEVEVITANFGEGDEYSINQKHFPDSAFMEYVSSEIDTNGNGFLSESEMAAVTEINVSGLGIETLSGIETFASLEILDCSDNELTNISVITYMYELTELYCSGNKISSLDLCNCSNLKVLDCSDNNISGIFYLDECLKLESVSCENNEIEEIWFYGEPELTHLSYDDGVTVYYIYSDDLWDE